MKISDLVKEYINKNNLISVNGKIDGNMFNFLTDIIEGSATNFIIVKDITRLDIISLEEETIKPMVDYMIKNVYAYKIGNVETILKEF